MRSKCSSDFSAPRRNWKTSCSTQRTRAGCAPHFPSPRACSPRRLPRRRPRSPRRRAQASAKSALAGETIEHSPPLRVLRDECVVRQLIEIKAGLLRMQQIDLQFQTGHFDLDSPGAFAAQNPAAQFHSFRATHRRVVALDDLQGGRSAWPVALGRWSARPTTIFQRPNDQLFSLIHREGERLQNEMVAVAIDDHAGQPIALAPDQPAKSRIDPAPRPILDRLRDSALEKIEIELLFPAREPPGHDLRFRVVDRAPDQMVATVLERDDIAVVRRAENFQDFPAEHPIVSVENPRARFNDESAHRLSLTGRAIVPASGSRSGAVVAVRNPHWKSGQDCLRVIG